MLVSEDRRVRMCTESEECDVVVNGRGRISAPSPLCAASVLRGTYTVFSLGSIFPLDIVGISRHNGKQNLRRGVWQVWRSEKMYRELGEWAMTTTCTLSQQLEFDESLVRGSGDPSARRNPNHRTCERTTARAIPKSPNRPTTQPINAKPSNPRPAGLTWNSLLAAPLSATSSPIPSHTLLPISLILPRSLPRVHTCILSTLGLEEATIPQISFSGSRTSPMSAMVRFA